MVTVKENLIKKKKIICGGVKNDGCRKMQENNAGN